MNLNSGTKKVKSIQKPRKKQKNRQRRTFQKQRRLASSASFPDARVIQHVRLLAFFLAKFGGSCPRKLTCHAAQSRNICPTADIAGKAATCTPESLLRARHLYNVTPCSFVRQRAYEQARCIVNADIARCAQSLIALIQLLRERQCTPTRCDRTPCSCSTWGP